MRSINPQAISGMMFTNSLPILGQYGKLWRNLSELGLSKDEDSRQIQKVILANRLSMVTLAVVAVSTLVFSFFNPNAELVYMIGSLMLAPLASLVLNHLGYTRYSRLVFGVLMPFMVLFIIVMLKVYSFTTNFVINEYHFYTPRYYMVAISLLPLFLIDISERFLFYMALGINVACLLMFDFVHDVCGVGHQEFGFEFHQYYQATVMPVVLLFFMYGSISFYQNENLKYQRRILGLLDKVKKHNDQFTQELQLAKKVMERLVPDQLPKIDGLHTAAFMQWSKEVGGDYYNIRKLNDGRYLMIVADVAGKGLPASILVSTLHSYVETHLNDNGEFTLPDFVTRLNKVLCRIMEDGKFITAWIGVYNTATATLESVNCGHPAPIIVNAAVDEERLLGKGGTILGFFEDNYLFETEEVTLEANDLLIAYTDGVSEATDEHEKLYEEHRLAEFLAHNKHQSPESLLRHLQLDLRRFVKGDNYEDDLTCLVLKKQ